MAASIGHAWRSLVTDVFVTDEARRRWNAIKMARQRSAPSLLPSLLLLAVPSHPIAVGISVYALVEV